MVLFCAGCDNEEAPAPEASEVVAKPEPKPAEPAKTPPPEPTPASDSKEPQDDLLAAAESYTPPFPNRVDPFELPKQSRSSVRVGEGGDDESVELKGFVMVDTPRVILSIDGFIVPLPEGAEKYGVEVISIEPPKVVLQRGRSRWTASLE